MTLSEERQTEIKERLVVLRKQREELDRVISASRIELMELEMKAAETRVQGLSWLKAGRS